MRQRRRQPEIMDRADLDERSHVQALTGLERINRWTGTGGIFWPAILEAARLVAPGPLTLLDVATGAGDTPIRLWRRSQRTGIPLEISGCDRSSTALAHARRRADQQGASVRFFPWDVLGESSPGMYDIVTCSLFLHHLSAEETVQALRNMARAARRLVLIHDLRRCSAGWWLAYLGTRLLSASPVVHFDGPVSVEGAYTEAEIRELADRAGLPGAVVTRRWPFRFLLTWWKGDP